MVVLGPRPVELPEDGLARVDLTDLLGLDVAEKRIHDERHAFGILVVLVAQPVVVLAVHDHAGMVLRTTDVPFQVPLVSVVLLGLLALPPVIPHVRQGEAQQHPLVVRGPQYPIERDVRARRAAVVVRVGRVVTHPLQAPERFARSLVAGRGCVVLRGVQRRGYQVHGAAVQVEVMPLDPELPEPEPHGVIRIDQLAAFHQLHRHVILILRLVEVPEPGRPPLL